MPLPLLSTVVATYIPRTYYVPAAFALIVLALLRTYTRGRTNTRLRDLHGRTVLVCGPVCPVVLRLAEHVANQHARTILLLPTGELSSPTTQSIVAALRVVTSNEQVHAADCDLSQPTSVRTFVEEWMKLDIGEALGDGRIDAVIFAHDFEFRPEAAASPQPPSLPDLRGAFLFTTLLLPLFLRAPSTRDIRIVTLVNPFYAAAFPNFPRMLIPTSKTDSINAPKKAAAGQGQREGGRALRTIIWARHLQRVLDALASGGGAAPSAASTSVSESQPQPEEKVKRRSNVTSVTVCAGFGRSETVGPYLRATGEGSTWAGFLVYILLYPLIWLFVKSSENEVQTALFALFAPPAPPVISPLADVATSPIIPSERIENRILGGQLYRECQLVLPPPKVGLDWGGEGVGRMVWEGLEADLGLWESAAASKDKEKGKEKEEKID